MHLTTTEICASFRQKAFTWQQVEAFLINKARLANPKLTKTGWELDIYFHKIPPYSLNVPALRSLEHVLAKMPWLDIDITDVSVSVRHKRAGTYLVQGYKLTFDGLFWEQDTFPNEMVWYVYKNTCLKNNTAAQ